MYSRIWSNERENRGKHTNEVRQTNITPVSTIGELREHFFCCVARCQNPEWDENGEEAANINQHDSFYQWESVRQVGVEDDGEKADGDNEESCLPILKYVSGIVDDEKALDLEGSEKGNAHDTRLPSQTQIQPIDIGVSSSVVT